jgi:hypothetical protein
MGIGVQVIVNPVQVIVNPLTTVPVFNTYSNFFNELTINSLEFQKR